MRPPLPPRRRAARVVPRHAAAVAVALGLVALPGPAAGATPPPRKRGADAGVVAVPTAPPFRPDQGVAEAAPPPFDRYRQDLGVAEAAPPPFDPDRLPPRPALPGWSRLEVAVTAEQTVYLSNVGKVSGAVTLPTPAPAALVFTVNGRTGDRLFQVTLRRKPAGDGQKVAVSVSAEPKVNVQLNGRALGSTPLTVPAAETGRRAFHFLEPESGAELRVVVFVGG